jgi:copper chaperone CopZ
MSTLKLNVPAIHCGHCTHTIEMELGELAGVRSVKASLDSKGVEIRLSPRNRSRDPCALSEINYPAEGLIAL